MKSRLILLLLAAPATAAFAQYKCTAANGGITFQQTPCPSSQTEQKLVVVPNGHPLPASGAAPAAAQKAGPAPASASGTSVDKRMLAKLEQQREGDELAQAVRSAQSDKDGRADQRQDDIAEARKRYGDDPAKAAALRDALASIDRRYQAMSDLDESHLDAARKALNEWSRTH